MKNLALLCNKGSDDELFAHIRDTFVDKITTWSYFVDWHKVDRNLSDIELDLNILNTLVGKEDIEQQTASLIMKFPQVVRVFPLLVASRDRSVKILVDTENFI